MPSSYRPLTLSVLARWKLYLLPFADDDIFLAICGLAELKVDSFQFERGGEQFAG